MAGMILGTAAYMAPEQAKGKVVDRRADIWAFGVVCIEMLTGRSPFQQESIPETLAAVLKGDADLERVPEPARPIIERCLRMDPRRRWQSIGDARIAIEEAQAGRPAQAGVPAPLSASERRRQRMVLSAALLLALVAIAAGIVAVRRPGESPVSRQVVRLRLDFPDGVTLPPVSVPAFSPDGSKVAAMAVSGSKTELWLRSLDSLAPLPLAGTEGVTRGPIFSPDSHSIAFTRGSSIWRLDLSSGSTQLLCELCGVPPEALAALERQVQPDAWSREGIILFTEGTVIKQVPASGGAAKPVTALAGGETLHFGATFLPDGRHFLYNALSGLSPGAVNVGLIDDMKFRKQILQRTDKAAYAPPGWLLFSRAGVLLAQPFDADKLKLSGESTPVTEPVAGLPFLPGPAFSFLPGYAYSASETGSLAWRPGFHVTSMELTWFDRTGKKLGSVGEPGEITNPVLSPDGKRVLITVRDPATRTRDIWILDLARGANSRLTFDPAEDHNPVWSPDGAYVIFSSNRKGRHDIYRKRSDGVGVDEELLVSEVDKGVDSLSPDGKSVLYNVQGPGGRTSTLWSVPIIGPIMGTGNQRPLSRGLFSRISGNSLPMAAGSLIRQRNRAGIRCSCAVRPVPACRQ